MRWKEKGFKSEILSVMNHIGISANKISYLASGDDSDTFLCDEAFVIKIPKRREVQESQRREFDLYGFLERQQLPFHIPKVIYQSDDFNVMSFLSGEQISLRKYLGLSDKEKEALAEDEALFLLALHKLKIDTSSPPFCEAVEDKYQRYAEEYSQVCEALRKMGLMNISLQRKIDRIYENILSNDELFQYVPCLTHNDFSSDNMVFRNNRLYGVIDFGDFVVGDPDNDFLCILDCSEDDFGKEFGRKVLKHYGHAQPEAAERKAELNDAYWPLQQIVLGSHRKDTGLIQQGYHQLLSSDPNVFLF